jgi:hypothetical protein
VQKGWIALWQEQASRIGKQQLHMLTILYNEFIFQSFTEPENVQLDLFCQWAEKWVYLGIGARQ